MRHAALGPRPSSRAAGRTGAGQPAAGQLVNESARLGEDHLVAIDALAAISDTALTRDTAIELAENGLPNTFVPGRNLLFLTLAAAVAYRRDLQVIVTGVCETDFSGYPDCRDNALNAREVSNASAPLRRAA